MNPSLKDLASNIFNFFQQFSLPGQNQPQNNIRPQQDPNMIKLTTTVSPNFVNEANAQQPAQPITQQPDPNFRFAFDTLGRDQYYAMNGPRPNFQPNQPPAHIGEILRRIFPNEATQSAAVAASENAQYDPRRPDAVNYDESGNEVSRDRGIMQINSNTFNGLMQRQGDRLKSMGITSYEDMYDPEMNAQVAKLIKEGARAYRPETNPEGWGGWYGWQDTGYDLNKGYFTQPKRVDYELKKRGRK